MLRGKKCLRQSGSSQCDLHFQENNNPEIRLEEFSEHRDQQLDQKSSPTWIKHRAYPDVQWVVLIFESKLDWLFSDWVKTIAWDHDQILHNPLKRIFDVPNVCMGFQTCPKQDCLNCCNFHQKNDTLKKQYKWGHVKKNLLSLSEKLSIFYLFGRLITNDIRNTRSIFHLLSIPCQKILVVIHTK